jgi:hypothetical protein
MTKYKEMRYQTFVGNELKDTDELLFSEEEISKILSNPELRWANHE